MTINNLERVNLNNSEQWLLVRGKRADAPLIIHVQAGPGFPMIPEANAMTNLLHLENDFLVAYWDQRGCGKSFHKNMDPATINFAQLTADVIACTQYLLKKYKKDKAIIIGYSIGATLSLMASAKDSSLFDRLFLVGLDIDIPTANNYAIEFIKNKAREHNNPKLLAQAIELSQVPITNAKVFQKRAKLLTDLRGIKVGSNYKQLLMATISNMLSCKEYHIGDIFKTIIGLEFCQNALLPEMDTLNLFEKIKSIGLPVHFIQGKLDGIAPYQTAVKYYEYLQACKKTFTSFENSAHMPHYDEPEKFVEVVREMIGK
jgi:pimeloyl-ACP methyl ester carboxylesterase